MQYEFLYAKKDLSFLIVEDEELVRKNTVTILKRRFGTIYEATNGEDGLALYKKHKPDIIISDIKMPIKSGIDMVKDIKELNKDVSVIFLTAFNDINFLMQTMEIGVTHFLTKPVNIRKLFDKIDEAARIIYLERKESDDRELFSALAENSLSGIFIGAKRFEYVNPSLVEMTGYSKEELLGMDIHEIFDEEHQERIKRASVDRHTGMKNENRKNELTILTKEGMRRWVLSSTTTISLKNRYLTLGNMIDISDMKGMHLEFERLATTDQLTGIYNRRKFEELMESEILRSKRYSRTFSLIMYDLDKFKEINDTYGHIKGDEVLKKSVEVVKGILRKSDYFCRWGGEEFFILLPEVALNDACIVAEKLRYGLEHFDEADTPKMTASFGVVEFEPGNSDDELIQKADRALYLSKKNGRNRVEFG